MWAGNGSNRAFTGLTVVWLVLAVGGSALWLSFVNGAEELRAWRALLVSFMYFTPLAGGLVVWPAVVRRCNGSWHEPVEPLAAAGIVFALPSIIVLALLWAGSRHWAPWYGRTFHQGVWLDNSFLFGRNLFALILFWGVALRYLVLRARGRGELTGTWLVLLYCLVFSLLGFDLVMALDPHWYSTLAGAYFFISGLYTALAAWALLASGRPAAGRKERHDLGRLIVAFSLMTTYMMYSHLLPIWYENLPQETRFLVPRMNREPWLTVSYGLVGTVYLGPLVLLLTEWSKRNRWALGALSLLVLAGMWVERWWLIMPTMERTPRIGLVELSVAAAFIGMLGIGMQQFNRRMPRGLLTTAGENGHGH